MKRDTQSIAFIWVRLAAADVDAARQIARESYDTDDRLVNCEVAVTFNADQSEALLKVNAASWEGESLEVITDPQRAAELVASWQETDE